MIMSGQCRAANVRPAHDLLSGDMLDEAHRALRRREIRDYADTIRILKERGEPPAEIARMEADLENVRKKLVEDDSS